MSVGKIIPKFDGESVEYMDIHPSTRGIVLHVIAKSRRGDSYIAKTLKQVPLLAWTERSEKIQNINGNKQP